jgi:hypothetical protein
MNQRTLNKILKYENEEIIAKFVKNFGIPKSTAKVIFKDMLRFLYLSQREEYLTKVKKKKDVPSVAMLEWFLVVDEMWHTFVLYTSEYAAFCNKYFGEFINHIPTPILKNENDADLHDLSDAEYEEYIQKLIVFTANELGVDVADRWFIQYPKKYSPKELKRRQLKSAS